VETLGHDSHILVVEDDADSRAALCDALIDSGYLPFAVGDGVEALEHLRTGARPNLIVLDLMLPRIDGWRFLSILSNEADLSAIPVLVCSGAVDPHPPGVPRDHVLTKPIKLDALMEFVTRYCGPGAIATIPDSDPPKRTPASKRRRPRGPVKSA
jgi:CheY-like chemotaxis protein